MHHSHPLTFHATEFRFLLLITTVIFHDCTASSQYFFLEEMHEKERNTYSVTLKNRHKRRRSHKELKKWFIELDLIWPRSIVELIPSRQESAVFDNRENNDD